MQKCKRNVLFILFVSVLLCCLGIVFFGGSFKQEKIFAKEDSEYSISSPDYGYNFDSSNTTLTATVDFLVDDTTVDELSDNSSDNCFYFVYGRKDLIEYVYDVYLGVREDAGLWDYTWNSSSFYCSDYFSQSLTSAGDGLRPYSLFNALKEADKTGTFNYIKCSDDNLDSPYISFDIVFGKNADNLYEYGYFACYYRYNYVYYNYKTQSDFYSFNPYTYFENAILNALTYEEVKVAEKVLGTYREGNTTVTYDYLVMQDGHFNKFETKTGSISIPSYLVPREDYVKERILACDYVGGKGLAGFNANFVSSAGYEMSNDVLAQKETFGSRIIRQATGFDYSYKSYTDAIPATVSMNVTYTDYNYKDFFIRVSNINEDASNNLAVDFYPTEVVQDVSFGVIKYTLYFDFQKLFETFNNTMHWAVLEDTFKIYYDSADVERGISVREEEISDAIAGAKRLVVYVSDPFQSNLFGLEITAQVHITQPVELDATLFYCVLDDNLSSSYSSVSIGKVWSNEIGEVKAELLNKDGAYADKVYGSLKNETTGNFEYLKPIQVYHSLDLEAKTISFQVYYETLPVLVIKNNINDDVLTRYIPDSIAVHTFEDFNVTLPEGYRVVNITCDSPYFMFETVNKDNPLKSTFVVSGNRDGSYEIMLIFTDKWQVKINYLEQYKSSCFAVMKEFEGEIKVSDYEDIYALSGSDVSKILGQDVVVLNFNKKSVKIDKVNVTFNEGNLIYTIDLTYTPLSVKTMDSNGDSSELLVGLTPYSEWNEVFGKNWSIVYLAPHVFQYTNDVDTDKLYGFFSVVTFKEQITNFNSWFKEYTSDGCVTVFSNKEVKGSEWYKFLNNSGPMFAIGGGTVGFLVGHPLTGAATGVGLKYSLMSAAELANDENGTYYSYFFYLDGTSDKSYASHNGADNYADEDSAVKNKADDVADDVKVFFSGIWDKIKSFFSETTVGKIIKWTAIILGGLIGLTVVIAILKWIYRKITS